MEIILALARSTSMDELCTLWGLSERSVVALLNEKRPMSIRELGALAGLHKIRTSDLLG